MPADVPYALTAHAAKVIGEREIPVEWVARALAQPERTEADAVDPALRHALARIPEYGGRVLRVVYNSTVEPWRIVTVYFDRKERSGA
jgi:hypothetical protein